jgi:hypothetical protein
MGQKSHTWAPLSDAWFANVARNHLFLICTYIEILQILPFKARSKQTLVTVSLLKKSFMFSTQHYFRKLVD